MTDITKINGIPITDINNISSITADINNVLNINYADDNIYLRANFDNINEGSGVVPFQWATNTDSKIYFYMASSNFWNSFNEKWNLTTLKWGALSGETPVTADGVFEAELGRTPSLGTGPRAGHNSADSTTGEFADKSKKYMYIESSNTPGGRYLLRTPGVNVSSAPANNTLKLSFWFHMFGSMIGSLGVAVTTSSNDASNKSEASQSLGFLSDTTGGAKIYFWSQNRGATTSSNIRITGEQQPQGDRRVTDSSMWRKAEVDLNSLAGSSEDIYIWFFGKTKTGTKYYRGDIAIDDVIVAGE